jgi:hypothetical protein
MREGDWWKYCAAIALALWSVRAHLAPQSQASNSSPAKIQIQPNPNMKTLDLSSVQKELHSLSRAVQRVEAKLPVQDNSSKRSADAAVMAAWCALLMVIVALADTAITGLGVWLIRRTLDEARKSADEARRQANAAETALAQTKTATENDLRAWLDVDVTLDSCRRTRESTHFTFDIKLTNIGKTPALAVATSQKIRLARSIVSNGGELPELEKHPSPMASMMPGKEVPQKFGLRFSNREIEDKIASHGSDPSSIMVVVDVVIYYRTCFDAPNADYRLTSIRYHIHPGKQIDSPHEFRRTWLRYINGTNTVMFSHDKSAPVYIT